MTAIRIPGRNGPVDAVVNVPGSKSVANRALLCAALVESATVSRVSNVPGGDDCLAMVAALESCSAMTGESVKGGVFPGSSVSFHAGIAGTTSRFLTAASCLSPGPVVIDGGEPLRRRPMGDLHDALRALGARVVQHGGSETGHLPVSVGRGSLSGGTVSVRGDVSSQFISSLMLLAPRLPGGLVINVEGELVSRPYVEMTAQVMRSFGADVTFGAGSVAVGETPYRSVDYGVEPDYSSAAFAVMSLAFTEGRITVPGLADAAMQGDSYVLEIARMMGLSVGVSGRDVTVTRDTGVLLSPVRVNLADASDLVPAVAVACTAIEGHSSISGVGFIRAKESDRLGDLADELNRAGASVEVTADGLEIQGGRGHLPQGRFATHHDHRLAMAFALIAGGGTSVEIEDAEVVTKSWPTYFGDMSGVLGPVEQLN